MRERYEANLRLSRRRGFVRRVRAFLIAHQVAVVRLHVGGDFYSKRYARKWLRVIRRHPEVRFYFYTRAWRDAAILPVLEEMAQLSNCRVWYSCDSETGMPPYLPPRVRVAWLMTTVQEQPPTGVHLVFRTRGLRRQPASHINGARVCPAEDGLPRTQQVTCDQCGICWHPLGPEQESAGPITQQTQRRTSLPLLPPDQSPSV
jgi:hypothetical protein